MVASYDAHSPTRESKSDGPQAIVPSVDPQRHDACDEGARASKLGDTDSQNR